MAHALAMRATSLAVSAALLGLAVILALTATYIVNNTDLIDDGPIILTENLPPPKPPAEPVTRNDPPPTRDVEESTTTPISTMPVDTEEAGEPTSFVTEAGPVAVTDPHWLERPRNLARYYPRRALAREIEGIVTLDCLVTVVGRLACNVISESPRGWDFGDAALRIAADHRMEPAMRDGAAVQGRYRMRVPFALD